jgi:hypothetical protein
MTYIRSLSRAQRKVRLSWRSVSTSAAVLLLSLATAATGLGSAASAAPAPRAASSAPCNVTISGGGEVVGSFIVGAVAGSTQLTFDCLVASGASLSAEVSPLAGVGSSAAMLASEADTSAISAFTASATDTGCPGGMAGTCTVATFAVPATFTASDANGQCPPTQAQINAGLFGCAVAVATAQDAPLAEYLMSYASQTTPPNPPTIAATVAAGPPGSTITISDAAANTGYWWANAIQQSQAEALGMTPATQPSTCGSGGGYGNVPSPFLAVNWFAAGVSTAIAGSAAGVTISNDCYNGTTLFAPVLGGTIPVPSALTDGTSYTAYVCEANFTSTPGNDSSATAHCGAPLPGTNGWIDASFPFTATAGTPQSALTVSSVSGSLGTALTLATSGGSGTGAVSFVAVNGTASGCTVTSGALSASSGGTCIVTATKASDSTYLAVSSTPTTVTLTAPPVVALVSTKVTLAKNAKTLPIAISCTNAPCDGTLSVSAKLTVRKANGKKASETLSFGSHAYQITKSGRSTVAVGLSAAARSYLKANPNHSAISATINVTDNLGKKHTLGRVSLLK